MTTFIKNRLSEKFLTVFNRSHDDGAELCQFELTGDGSQQWSLEQVEPGVFKIRNLGSGKVVDVPGGTQDAGTVLIQFDDNGGTNQLWRMGTISDVPNAVFFTNVATGQAMNVIGRSFDNNARVIQFPDFENKIPQNEQWFLSNS
jgi:alpha-L-fucosidase 2